MHGTNPVSIVLSRLRGFPLPHFPASAQTVASLGSSVSVRGALLYLIFVIIICHSLHECEGTDIIKIGILDLMALSCIFHVKSWN